MKHKLESRLLGEISITSDMENPRDGGAWWSAIYGVAQSRTRLKQLSSSSSKTSPTPFEHNGLLFWVPDVLCRHSEVILWDLLSVQMFFWWIYGGESGLPVLFLCHLLVFVLIFHVRDKRLLIICSVDFNKTQRAQGLTLSNLSVPATVL